LGFGVDEAHRQRARDLAIAVAHEDRAELLAALQAGDRGLHHVAVAVQNEQVVAAGVGGHDDHARRDWLRHHEGRGGKLLRLAANASVLVMPQRLQVRAVGQDARQDGDRAAAGAVVSLEPVACQ
jgi:protein involved in temperature-dependent protein secretion